MNLVINSASDTDSPQFILLRTHSQIRVVHSRSEIRVAIYRKEDEEKKKKWSCNSRAQSYVWKVAEEKPRRISKLVSIKCRISLRFLSIGGQESIIRSFPFASL